MNVDALNGRLLFAIPKKGRLHEKCMELLAGADIQFRRDHRLDVCLVKNHNIALVFLPAADIPSFVGKGNVDLGITGQDVLQEAQMQQHVTEVLPLSFGKCALQVQVPEAGPIQTVEQLAGKRVVTSFEVLSGEYFGKLDEKLNLAEIARPISSTSAAASRQRARLGSRTVSVRTASARQVLFVSVPKLMPSPAVDLVESGDTMRAAGLHAIATLMQSEAVLIKSSTPKHESLDPLIKLITARIAGVVAASKYVVCEYNIPRAKLHDATGITPGRRAPTISPLEDEAWVAVSSMVEKKRVADVMDELVKIGAEDILIFNLDNCRV
ncbi:hypothetical protein EVJ58_g4107 [Rhodofomes roseus]|uniref:ATP phosphoribosyltransferase n=1 Tax=Rhodofomes roseus TaxID=34475 RepID=A0A4Y9YIS5_9APHY|nr:hypothetical protein EVJ58_g4107 [Rhodofomes roseus]